MVVVKAVLRARVGKAAELESMLRELIPRVKTEAGTLGYALNRSRDTDGCFYFYERYRDQAACDAHMAKAYLAAFISESAPLLAEGPKIAFYDEVDAFFRPGPEHS